MMSIEKAIARETARGRPSGTATITTVIAIVNNSMKSRRVCVDRSSLLDENMILQIKKRPIVKNTRKPAR